MKSERLYSFTTSRKLNEGLRSPGPLSSAPQGRLQSGLALALRRPLGPGTPRRKTTCSRETRATPLTCRARRPCEVRRGSRRPSPSGRPTARAGHTRGGSGARARGFSARCSLRRPGRPPGAGAAGPSRSLASPPAQGGHPSPLPPPVSRLFDALQFHTYFYSPYQLLLKKMVGIKLNLCQFREDEHLIKYNFY